MSFKVCFNEPTFDTARRSLINIIKTSDFGETYLIPFKCYLENRYQQVNVNPRFLCIANERPPLFWFLNVALLLFLLTIIARICTLRPNLYSKDLCPSINEISDKSSPLAS